MSTKWNIIPFPFEGLPRLSSEQLSLRHKLSDLYTLLEDHTDLTAEAVRPIAEVMGQNVTAEPVHVEVISIDELTAALPEAFLFTTVRVDPHTKRAFVVFDTVLAGVLVDAVLSGGRPDLTRIDMTQLKPLTPLSEAVAQYAVVAALEQISQILGPKNFSLAFDAVIRDGKKIKTIYAPGDTFAVFSFKLLVGKREFFFKVGLPLSVAENAGATKPRDAFFTRRMAGFNTFRVDLELVAGTVEIAAADWTNIEKGDILMFDECQLEQGDNGLWSGRGWLCPEGTETRSGFAVDLDSGQGKIQVRVSGGLE